MTVKRRLSQIFGSLRLKRKARKVVELSTSSRSHSQSRSQLLEDKENSLDGSAENSYLDFYNEKATDLPIVLFAQLQVEILPETTYPASPILPANKSGDNLIHSAHGTPRQNTNSHFGGDDRKIEHYYEAEESIGQIGSVPTTQSNSTLQPTSEQRLKRRLSLKGLKKSGKGILKVLQTGFVAMGNTNTMMHASLASPQVYELSIAMGEQRNQEYDYTQNGKYEMENAAYRKDYVEFYGRRQLECSKISRCEYDW